MIFTVSLFSTTRTFEIYEDVNKWHKSLRFKTDSFVKLTAHVCDASAHHVTYNGGHVTRFSFYKSRNPALMEIRCYKKMILLGYIRFLGDIFSVLVFEVLRIGWYETRPVDINRSFGCKWKTNNRNKQYISMLNLNFYVDNWKY